MTVAPTGGMASKAQNHNLPTQPGEIAESVHKSWKEGAAIAALHARRPDDEATCNAEIYRDINRRIRERCDIILNNSTGGGSSLRMPHHESRRLHLVELRRRIRGLRRAGDGVGCPASQGAAADFRPRVGSPPMTPKRKRFWMLLGSLAVLGVLCLWLGRKKPILIPVGYALIALAAAMRLQSGRSQASMTYAFDVRPRWPLDQLDQTLTAP